MNSRRPTLFAAGGAIMVVGVALAYSAYGPSPVTPSVSPTASRAPQKSLARIAWQPSFEAALNAAKTSGKPVMVDFYATWCGPCKEMEAKVYPDQAVIDESANFVSVKVDTDARMDLTQKYQINSLPTIMWMRADGSIIDSLSGATQADELVQMMRSARANAAPPTI